MADAITSQFGVETTETLSSAGADNSQSGLETFTVINEPLIDSQFGAETFLTSNTPLVNSEFGLEVFYLVPTKTPSKGGKPPGSGGPGGKKAYNTELWLPWSEVNFLGVG